MSKKIANIINIGLIFLCFGMTEKIIFQLFNIAHWVQLIEVLLSGIMVLFIPLTTLFYLKHFNKLMLRFGIKYEG